MKTPPPNPSGPARDAGGRLLLNVVELNPSDTSPVDVRRTNVSAGAAPAATIARGRCPPPASRRTDDEASVPTVVEGLRKQLGKRTVSGAAPASALASNRGGKAVKAAVPLPASPVGDVPVGTVGKAACDGDADGSSSNGNAEDSSDTGLSSSTTELDSSDDPEKVAYTRPDKTRCGVASSSSKAAVADLPTISFTTGDLVLKAGVLHAVRALGEYKVWRHRPSFGADGEPVVTSPAVFVVSVRPRRSVRLLVALTRGAWVVSDSWLLDSMRCRAWKPCHDYVPEAFPGVVAARNAHAAGESLLRGARVGFDGDLRIDVEEFIQLVEGAGGVFMNRGATVLVVRASGGSDSRTRIVAARYVNEQWLPDTIARWKVQPYSNYAPE